MFSITSSFQDPSAPCSSAIPKSGGSMNNPFAPHLAIAQRGWPFAAADGQAFVRLANPSSGGFYILPVRSRAYRDWFLHEFYVQHDTLPTSRAFHAILNHLEAEAHLSE